MKVLNIFYNFTQGGVERLGITVANCLPQKGVESYVCVINDERDEKLLNLFSDEVHLILLKKEKYRKLGYLKQLVEIIKREKITVVHVHQGSLMSFYLLLKILCPSVKVFFTVHDTFIYSELSNRNRRIANLICHKLIAISDGVVDDMKGKGAPEKKICRIYNGVQFDNFVVRDENSVKDIPVIANVARFFPKKKGQDILIRAAAELMKRNVPTKIVFAGGELYEGEGSIAKMRQLASELKIEQNVEFLGNITDVNSFLQEANIFCIPSNYEGFGISAVEAMGTGLPCVASNIVGLNEVVNSADIGELFEQGNHIDLADKLEKVIQNISKYEPHRIAEDVRTRFSVEKMVDNLKNAYES